MLVLNFASAVNNNTTAAVKSGIFKGEYSLIFFTPELLLQERRWRDLLNSKIYVHTLTGFVVDEAHCVKNGMLKYRYSNL